MLCYTNINAFQGFCQHSSVTLKEASSANHLVCDQGSMQKPWNWRLWIWQKWEKRILKKAEKKQLCCSQSRAYQLGLSLGDLAVILLQDFFQLLPLRFFFFLHGWHGSMLAHEQATATKHFMFIHTHLASNCLTHTLANRTHTHTANPLHNREVCLASRTWPHCGILCSQPELF